MEIFESFSKSVEYASKLLSRGAELIAMIIVNIIPVVNFIFVGYCAKILREGPSKNEPPKFERFGELFVEGVKIFVVGLLWAILPMVVGVLSLVLTAPWIFISGMANITWLSGGALLLAMFLILVVGICIGIFGVVSLMLAARTGDIAKGFSFQHIMSVINNVGFVNHVIWVVVAAVIAFIVSFFSMRTFIGWLIGVVISPLLGTFLVRAATLFYSDAVERALLPLPPPPPPV